MTFVTFILIMNKRQIDFTIEEYNSIEDMAKEDAELLTQARKITSDAYAPYSNFQVAAFAKLVNGKTIGGTNQENASYPAGICAERSLMSAASSLYPGVGIETIAITYNNLNGKSEHPISPCGICRQSFAEFQQRTKQTIRIILSGMEGKVQIINDSFQLLPLVFTSEDMNKEA